MKLVRPLLVFCCVFLSVPAFARPDSHRGTLGTGLDLAPNHRTIDSRADASRVLPNAIEIVRIPTNDLDNTPVAIAFDGRNYWIATGGNSSGTNLGRYSADGMLIETFSTGIDYRSLFVRTDGSLYASSFDPGTNIATKGFFLQHTDGTVTKQYNASFSGFQSTPIVSPDGTLLYDRVENNVTVQEFEFDTGLPTANSFNLDVQEPGVEDEFTSLVTDGERFFMLGNGVVSVYDGRGDLVGSSAVPGFGDTYADRISFSHANNLVFVVDDLTGEFVGFDVGFAGVMGCLEMNGAPVGGHDLIVKQGKKKRRATTFPNGCYQVYGLKSGKPVKVLIKGPSVP